MPNSVKQPSRQRDDELRFPGIQSVNLVARTIHSTKIPSSTRHLGAVRSFVEKHAHEAELPDLVVEQLKIAVDEACTNVIEHAYKGEEGHEIDLAVIIDPKRFTVRIRDTGSTFNRAEYTEPDLFAFAQRRKAGGFGVHIMHRLMDSVEYNKRGNVNECCLIKYRTPANGEGH